MKLKLEILVLEDQESDLELIKYYVSTMDCSCKVYHANSEKSFIEAFDEVTPDIILSDYKLNGYNGLSALEYSKSKFSEIPFVMLTGTLGEELAVQIIKKGASDFILKNKVHTLPQVIIRALREAEEKKAKIKAEQELKNTLENLEILVEERTLALVKSQQHLKKALKNEKKLGKLLIEKQKDLKNSITYAEKMQQKIFPTLSKLNEHFDNFCLHLPKDVLSGDFYWSKSRQDYNLIAAIDCAGHGVPAAMTTMIAYSFLNRAVEGYNITQPGAVLTSLHQQFNNYIDSDKMTEYNEGMDMGMIQIDKKNKEMIYAGARRPLYIIRSKNKKNIQSARVLNEKNGFVLFEIKGDRYSIDAQTPKEYTNHTINLESGDVLYIFSDGITDQFGGVNNKKFGRNRLRNLLLEIQNKNMIEQKKTLSKTIHEWRNGNNQPEIQEQTDDILIIGLSI